MLNNAFLAFEEYLRAERRASEKTIVAYQKELERW
jgi:site-specific recombinase XerC